MTATDTQAAPASPRGFRLPDWLIAVLHLLIVVAMPLTLVLLNARVLMSEAFIRWEYNQPNFPADPFGFTQEDRLAYAPPALAYLFNDEDISYLGDQTFPDGTPLYNERELSHMVDVKVVTQDLLRFGYGLLAVVGLSLAVLAFSANGRDALRRALLRGGLLTVALIVTGLVTVALAFRWLFTQFHALFFEGDSWLFAYSDTLIRLFPEKFWTDAFVLMFAGALVEAILIAVLAWIALRRRAE